jgi:mono/diheme cytochrome c family protein
MKVFNSNYCGLILLGALPLVMAGCGGDQVSFSQQVMPILDQHCIECHQADGKGLKASGFSMESYGDLMKGTRHGPMIIAGDVLGSNILVLMEGRADPSINMPHGARKQVPKIDIQTIKSWIEQGAKNN